MIPASNFLIDGDTAWVLYPFEAPLVYQMADRPCETCGGGWHPDYGSPPCDCIDGRHTFDIEVECGCDTEWNPCSGIGFRTYRVAIIEVLPIVDIWPTDAPAVFHDPTSPVSEWWSTFAVPCGWNVPITLPPAAAPGMYAVRLKLADKEET